MNSKETYYPSVGDTGIELSSEQQDILDNNVIKSIAVYVNGLRMDEDDDYTFNTSTYTFTFDEAFEGGEKVIIVLSYMDDSTTDIEGNYNSSKYEKTLEKTKVYSTFTTTTLNLDIDNYSIFVIDMTTNTSNNLTINIPSTNGELVGKVLLLTIILGNSIPTIAWCNNILWNTIDYTAPALEANRSYNISFIQINNTTKYIGDLNSEFATDDLVISSS